MTNVTLKNLYKIYEGTTIAAVKDLNLEIKAGELVALLGPSGCGKTTTLKMIAGLHDVSQGDVLFDGVTVNDIKPEKREVVMVYQNYLLFPYMNVEDNIGFGLRMRKVPKPEIAEKVKKMLKLVQLEGFEKRKPSQLSGGQKQRIALARALIIRPKILLLDEPLSNLDAHLRDEMREMILNIHREFGLTTIFVTHDQEEAVLLADRIALMFDGELQQYSPPKDFYERPMTKRIAAFFGNRNCMNGTLNGNIVHTNSGDFEVTTPSARDGQQVSLVIRPESVLLEKSDHNCFKARIDRVIYMGTSIRYRIAVDDGEWVIMGDPHPLAGYEEGKEAWFTLPQDKIWLIPESNERT
jgi:putative spermidine/putrescine transport system ATP-binding protein